MTIQQDSRQKYRYIVHIPISKRKICDHVLIISIFGRQEEKVQMQLSNVLLKQNKDSNGSLGMQGTNAIHSQSTKQMHGSKDHFNI